MEKELDMKLSSTELLSFSVRLVVFHVKALSGIFYMFETGKFLLNSIFIILALASFLSK